MPLTRFNDLAEALRDISRYERMRLHLIDLMKLQGRYYPAPDEMDLSGLRRRAALLEQSAELITILAPHEEQVRALDPLLNR